MKTIFYILLSMIVLLPISKTNIHANDKMENDLISFKESLEKARSTGDQQNEGQILSSIARLYSRLGNYDKALDHYEKALGIFIRIDDRRGEGNSLNRIGNLYHFRDQYKEALNYFYKALKIFIEISDKEGEGDSLNNIGKSYYELSLYDKALDFYGQALGIFLDIDDKSKLGSILGSIGIVYHILGQLDIAKDHYKKNLEISREIGDKRGEGSSLANIGNIYSNLGQYDKALDYLQQSLEIRKETGERNAFGNIFLSFAVIYFNMGQYKTSINYLEKSIDILRELGDISTEGYSLSSIGAVYSHLGVYDRALEYFERSLEIRIKTGHKRGEGNNLNHIGSVFHRLGQYETALSYYKQALEIIEKTGVKRSESNSLYNIGLVYYGLGQYDKALEYYDRALNIRREIEDKKGEGACLGRIGSSYHRIGEYNKASMYHEQSLEISREIGDKRGEAISLYNIAMIYHSLGQYNKALKDYKLSIQILQQLGLPEQLWRVQIALARSKSALNKFERAKETFKQGLNNLEKVRTGISDLDFRGSYMEEKLSIYDEYIEILFTIHQKNPEKRYDEKIFEIFERKQGRIFLEQISGIRSQNYSGIPEALLEKENDMIYRIEKLSKRRIEEISKPERDLNRTILRELAKQKSDLRAEQKKLKKKIKTKYPDYYELKYPGPVTLSSLQKDILRSDEMMLIFNFTRDTSFLLLIGREHFSLHHIPKSYKDLSINIKQYLALQIDVSDTHLRGRVVYPDFVDIEIPEIYNMLFPVSVQNTIANVKNLFIVPTGKLYMLPFEAILIDDETYLIERHSISYLSSASLLKILRDTQIRRRRYPVNPLLAFANPVYADHKPSSSIAELRSETYRGFLGNTFIPLPETEDEVIAIKEILQAPMETNPLQLREKASRSNVMALNEKNILEQYRYIIFACHGILPGEVNNILQPALVDRSLNNISIICCS